MFEAGLTEEIIRPFKEALIQGKTAQVIPLVTDDIVDKLAIAGNAAYCKDKLAAINAAGVSMPIAFELPGQSPLELVNTLERELLA